MCFCLNINKRPSNTRRANVNFSVHLMNVINHIAKLTILSHSFGFYVANLFAAHASDTSGEKQKIEFLFALERNKL